MKTKISGVYCIKCVVDDFMYVGSSNDIHRRWSWHRWALERGSHHCDYLQYYFDYYGEMLFQFLILKRTRNLIPCEQAYMDKHSSILMNVKKRSDGKGFLHSDSTKRKMSATAKEISKSKEERERRSARAKRQWEKGLIGRKPKPTRVCISCGKEFVRPRTINGRTSSMGSCIPCAVEHKSRYGGSFNIDNLIK